MAGNLGDYQRVVEWSKKLGGPKRLGAVVAAGGYAVGRAIGFSYRTLRRLAASKRSTESPPARTLTVTTGGTEGALEVRPGDQFRVLGHDGDAVLIERVGDPKSPYMVSEGFLRSVSDYPGESPQ